MRKQGSKTKYVSMVRSSTAEYLTFIARIHLSEFEIALLHRFFPAYLDLAEWLVSKKRACFFWFFGRIYTQQYLPRLFRQRTREVAFFSSQYNRLRNPTFTLAPQIPPRKPACLIPSFVLIPLALLIYLVNRKEPQLSLPAWLATTPALEGC